MGFPWIRGGRVTCTQGSATVTLTGGSWVGVTIRPGSVLVVGNRPYEIAALVNATTLTLKQAWTLPTITASYAILTPYRVVPPADQVLQAQALLAGYEEYHAQAADWLAGAADQGLDGQGTYPIRLLPCPERMALGPKPPVVSGRTRVGGSRTRVVAGGGLDQAFYRFLSPLSGLVAVKKFTLSTWFQMPGPTQGSSGSSCQFLAGYKANGAPGVTITKQVSSVSDPTGAGKIVVQAFDAASQVMINVISAVAVTYSPAWRHLAVSVDLTVPKLCLFLDGVDVLDRGAASTLQTNATLDPGACTEWRFQTYDGYTAELWFEPGLFLDFDLPANLQKFRTPAGKAVDLGASGMRTTGVLPAIFLSMDFAESTARFSANRGYGGGPFAVWSYVLPTYGAAYWYRWTSDPASAPTSPMD